MHILRDFDSSKLRRGKSKASVDILLKRMHSDLTDTQEGSKQCMAPRCRKFKPRSAFVSAETGCTRQWLDSERRCLACVALDKRERESRKHRLKCYGDGCNGAMLSKSEFSWRQRLTEEPTCRSCSMLRRCNGPCGKIVKVLVPAARQIR